MARYKSNIKIIGSVNGMTFRDTKYGPIVSGKTGPTRNQVRTDPRFARTRKMNDEFARACDGAKIFRGLFSEAIVNCYDTQMHKRLVGLMRKVISSDSVSPKGERNLLMGDNSLIKGFEWNKHASLRSIIGMNYKVDIHRNSGEVLFHFPSFKPEGGYPQHEAATHYRITAAIAELNWRDDLPYTARQTTGYLSLNDTQAANFTVLLEINKQTKNPIASSLSITWYVEVSGVMYPLQNAGYNAAAVVDVDVV